MGIIKELDQSSILRLAAGEIIDRPVSIVKELIENSIDAKATKITIDLQQGGISEIMISDNGNGILNDDIEKTIIPHATSKLNSFDDLQSVLTMGFRGEALASIAEVADVTIHSFNNNDQLGIELIKKATTGEFKVTHKAREQGTTITVAHLFKHIPVRYRFLKTPGSEAAAITKCIQQFALHYPSVGFKLTNNGSDILATTGTGDIVSQFKQVLQLKDIHEVIPFFKKTDQISVSGVILEPTVTFKNRSKCWFSVNLRMVQSPVFFKAVQQALQDIIPKQMYPALVCNIDCPTEDVDINIHPKKEDVKFAYSDQIFIAIKRAVQSGVNKKSAVWADAKPLINSSFPLSAVEKNEGKHLFETRYQYTAKNPSVVKEVALSASEEILSNESITNEINEPQMSSNSEDLKTSAVNLFQNQQEVRARQYQESKVLQTPLIPLKEDLKWLAFKNKYILVPTKDYVLIFDQHAVHERILYDQFKKQFMDQSIVLMPLLVPEYIKCSPEEYQKISEILPSFHAIGIDIKEFDQELYIVREIPQCLQKINISDWALNLIAEGCLISESNEEVIKSLQLKACKAAVKAGQRLKDTEVNALIERTIESDIQYTCPHGRPLYIKLSESKLDSLFLRS